jgi:hypothetical protein
MKTEKTYFIFLLTLTLVWGFCSVSQAQLESEALKSLQARPQVAVSANQRNASVTAALDIHVLVTNLTDSNIFLKNVEVSMPGEFWAARGIREIDEINKLTENREEVQLNPGNESLVSFYIPHQRSSLIAPLLNHQLLTFMPNDYEVRVIVTYQIPPKRKTVIQDKTKIYIEPTLSSLMWGGVLGSLLLALFLSTFRLWKKTTDKTLRQIVGEALVIFLAGSVCSVVVLILIYRFKELPLPINIAVNDFYGGIVVGLFSFILGDWLFLKLTGEEGKAKGKKRPRTIPRSGSKAGAGGTTKP